MNKKSNSIVVVPQMCQKKISIHSELTTTLSIKSKFHKTLPITLLVWRLSIRTMGVIPKELDLNSGNVNSSHNLKVDEEKPYKFN